MKPAGLPARPGGRCRPTRVTRGQRRRKGEASHGPYRHRRAQEESQIYILADGGEVIEQRIRTDPRALRRRTSRPVRSRTRRRTGEGQRGATLGTEPAPGAVGRSHNGNSSSLPLLSPDGRHPPEKPQRRLEQRPDFPSRASKASTTPRESCHHLTPHRAVTACRLPPPEGLSGTRGSVMIAHAPDVRSAVLVTLSGLAWFDLMLDIPDP